MATKKTTTKKKVVAKKVIVADVPRDGKAFDLSTNDPKENHRLLVAFETLIYTPGWQALQQIFKENIEYLEGRIIDKEDGNGNPLDEETCDKLRFKRQYLNEMIEKPEKWIKSLKQQAAPEEKFDPYFTKEDMAP